MPKQDAVQVLAELEDQVAQWLKEYGRHRSNLAGAIVVLDALKGKCPLTDEDVFTDGEVKRGRGQALFSVLDEYEIPRFLKDGTTTRGARASCARLLHMIDYGRPLAALSEEARSGVVSRLVQMVRARVAEWLTRHPLRVACDPASSTTAWVETILAEAKEHQSQGRIEQHLVGAKLDARHPKLGIPVHAATAGDVQTGRPGDFQVGQNIYHVTVAPSLALIEKCQSNLAEGLKPVVLVPRGRVERAKGLAESLGVGDRVDIWALEDFIAQNLTEMSGESGQSSLEMLRDVLSRYNQRVEQAEVDPALRIDLK